MAPMITRGSFTAQAELVADPGFIHVLVLQECRMLQLGFREASKIFKKDLGGQAKYSRVKFFSGSPKRMM